MKRRLNYHHLVLYGMVYLVWSLLLLRTQQIAAAVLGGALATLIALVLALIGYFVVLPLLVRYFPPEK
jgi:hypothetical protein